MVKAHSLEVHEFRLLQFTGELGVGNIDITQAGAWKEYSFLLSAGNSEPPGQEGHKKGTWESRWEIGFSVP